MLEPVIQLYLFLILYIITYNINDALNLVGYSTQKNDVLLIIQNLGTTNCCVNRKKIEGSIINVNEMLYGLIYFLFVVIYISFIKNNTLSLHLDKALVGKILVKM